MFVCLPRERLNFPPEQPGRSCRQRGTCLNPLICRLWAEPLSLKAEYYWCYNKTYEITHANATLSACVCRLRWQRPTRRSSVNIPITQQPRQNTNRRPEEADRLPGWHPQVALSHLLLLFCVRECGLSVLCPFLQREGGNQLLKTNTLSEQMTWWGDTWGSGATHVTWNRSAAVSALQRLRCLKKKSIWRMLKQRWESLI